MPKKPSDVGVQHKIQDGEWVATVAIEYGYSNWYDDVWKVQKNAELRKKRPDPHLLAEDDILFIPPWEEKEESAATEKKHKYKLKGNPELFRLRALDPNQEPIKNEPYVLRVNSRISGEKFEQQNKKTDDKGVLQEYIPNGAESGELEFPEIGIKIALDFGKLDPLVLDNKKALIRGSQQRLTSLGFSPGPIDGIDGPLTQDGVRAFQQFCKDNADSDDPTLIDSGPVDGIVGSKTIKALKSFYGC